MKRYFLALWLMLILPQFGYSQFNIQKFNPSPHAYDFITTESSEINNHLKPSFNFMLNYATNPLVFVQKQGNEIKQEVVNSLLGGDLLFSLSLIKKFEVGVDLPIFFYIGGKTGNELVKVNEVKSFSLGDLRLTTKFNLIKTHKKGAGLALGLDVTFPTAAENSYVGDEFLSLIPKLIFDLNYNEIRFAVNFGYRMRKNSGLGSLSVNDDLIFKAATSIPLVPKTLYAIGELSLNTEAAKPFDNHNTNYLEGDLGLKFISENGFNVMLGGGGGFLEGYGNPKYRIFASIGYFGRKVIPPDRDKDGIIDKKDVCPLKPEDKDGFQDSDGCPDPDNDNDGILDKMDKCPNKAEDKDGFQDTDGCPDLDNDGDGIPDTKDMCKNEAEDKDGFQDSDGCPDPDNDSDGIPDTKDKCPNKPETFNKYQDEDGCPDKAPIVFISKKAKKIIITQKIYFKKGTAIILKKSYPVLKAVVKILKEHPEILKVSVEGHTSTEGSKKFNIRLSKKRAKAIVKFLIRKGISKKRLTYKGWGPEKPIVYPDDTPEKREKNRRVEFIILEQK